MSDGAPWSDEPFSDKTKVRELGKSVDWHRMIIGTLSELLKYADHSKFCRIKTGFPPVCNCGFSALIKKVKSLNIS
jgi:hypothetical protein